MYPIYKLIKKIGIVCPLVLFSLVLSAQNDDSTRLLSQEQVQETDTLEPPPEEEIVDDETYTDEPVTTTNYFLRRDVQENGGGPDSIQSAKLPDSLLQKLQNDNDFWYVNYVFEETVIKKKKPLTEQPLFQIILWLVIIGGFAAFVIIYLANSNAGLFRKKSRALGLETETEVETDDIFGINYGREIDKAVSQGNYRFAVRLMFLRLLKNLSDKKVIDYKPDRTDFDYLLQISSTKYYHEFFRLTRNYEYSWYGQFDIDPEKFTLIRKDFENFESKLKLH